MTSITQAVINTETGLTKDQLLDHLRQIRVAERGALILGADPFPATVREKGCIVQELTEKHGMTHEQIAFATTMGAQRS